MEFGENGTMRRFFSAYRARIEILSSWHKIRANTRNWTAKVLLSRAIAQAIERKGGFGIDGIRRWSGILAIPCRSGKIFQKSFGNKFQCMKLFFREFFFHQMIPMKSGRSPAVTRSFRLRPLPLSPPVDAGNDKDDSNYADCDNHRLNSLLSQVVAGPQPVEVDFVV